MASTIKDIEETLEIVKTLISANLSSYLGTINTEKGDNYTCDAPRSTNYIISEIDAIPEFPFIQFVPDTSDTEIAGLAGGFRDEVNHNIIIKVHNVSKYGGPAGTTDAAYKSYRFTRAIREIILDNRTISDQVIGIQINNVNYAPMMTDGTNFKTEVWINCTVKHHCTFS
jgi:hypothetical protein